MISLEMARKLKEAGLAWEPAQGDRFALLIGRWMIGSL